MTTALRVHRLGKTFEAGFQSCRATIVALDDVNLDLAFGEVLAISGPPASGKTTLLRCVAGLLEPSSGSIFRGGPVEHGVSLEDFHAAAAPSSVRRICVWDDPLGGLTPPSEEELALWLRGMREAGHAILVAARSRFGLEACGSRVVVLERGRVAEITSSRRVAEALRTN